MSNALSIPEEDFEAAERAKVIADHNDRFRNTWGADFTIPGQIVMTRAVAALSPAWMARLMQAIQQFSDFTEDNDPYGDHSFGAVGNHCRRRDKDHLVQDRPLRLGP
ncbi:DUF3768 domain-containing protein [Yoonia sp. BS5-3]|uniref:DUF3768 domain-containing protein n=1 Tax=Yoonia phaeophyticola TaxID=3137369 RepID=A0ABZ2VA17_9RHOB